ncbi:hypothetical protein [Nostoc sp.]
MASIKISELRPAGSELFQDSESFLQELGAQEMGITGGAVVATLSVIKSVVVNSKVGNTVNANTYTNVNSIVAQ